MRSPRPVNAGVRLPPRMGIERQHFVGQGFLTGFSEPNPRSNKFIWLYRKDHTSKPQRRSVKSVAWQSFYYEQETEAGARDTDTLETAFAQSVDRIVPDIIRSLDTQPGRIVSLPPIARGTLAYFLGISLTRVPAFREPIREFHTRIAQRALESAAEHDANLKAFVEAHGITAEAKPWVSLRPMMQLAQIISRSALEKNWQFFVPPPGIELVTSDNPVIFDVARSYGLDSAGPAHPLAELVTNLRKDLALVCTPRRGEPQYAVFQMTPEEAWKFNRGIIRAARSSVFAPIRSPEIDQLVKDYIGQQQTILLD
jgi:Protein of unknown function (DUF4238)